MEQLWPTAIKSLVPLIAVVLAYFLGGMQGRAQVRHVERAKVIVELRRRLLVIMRVLEKFQTEQSFVGEREAQRESANRMFKKTDKELSATRHYYLVYRIWLGRKIRKDLEAIFDSTMGFLEDEVLRSMDAELEGDYDVQGAQEWLKDRLSPLLAELEEEASRLLGTREPWWRRIFGS